MNLLAQAAAMVGAITALGGTAGFIAEPHITQYLEDRYATIEMVGSNSQQIALIAIENARRSGNQQLLTRLCDDFQRTHDWTPSACR